jgi:hypothetical protein
MAASYAGSYLTEAGVEFVITALDGTLALQFAQQPALRLLPASERDFFSKQLNISVVFEKRGDGQVTGLTVSQEGTTFEAKRRDSG